MNIFETITNRILGKKPTELAVPATVTPKPVVLPSEGGRVSELPRNVNTVFDYHTELSSKYKLIEADTDLELIPLIRKLVKYHPDLGQALNNVVELANTGIAINFDDSVQTGDINKMREIIMDKGTTWFAGQPSLHSGINKMLSQMMVGGALSNEWVPEKDLSGIRNIVLVNPEEIQWVFDKSEQTYLAYQKVNPKLDKASKTLKKLNPLTYKYYALNGDTEIPYGYSPYLAALKSLGLQESMLTNIDFIVDQIGIMGFLEVLLTKPEKRSDESESGYIARLTNQINQAKVNLSKGLKDGISVGYKDDTEYKFNSTTRNIEGLDKLYQLNALNAMSGMKQDPALMGRSYSTTETQIAIIFTKLLSQLKNLQTTIAANLEYGFGLHLRLMGYKFKKITVKFNESTALDKLKEEQAEEIRLRNSHLLYADGIISQDQYAHRHGFGSPDQKEPRVDPALMGADGKVKKDRKDQKNKSDRKGTEKKAPASKGRKINK